LITLVVLAGCGKSPPPQVATSTPVVAKIPKGDPVEGARVARRVGCDGCHSEGGKGGGMDIKAPTGDRVVAPNLTERRALYDDAGIAKLLHEGKTHDGHRAFGMPIYMFQHLSDREVRDITAWLRSLPAVENPGLAESALTRATLKQLEDGTHPYGDDDRPDPGNVPPGEPPTEPLALGRHLAMTSCSECHGRDLTGWGPEDDAPSLVLINKAYTPEKFARLMRTGEIAAGGKSKTGFMSEVATYRFASALTEAEIAALKQYLDSR
jgi:mono/diheme cytochrome c family protein